MTGRSLTRQAHALTSSSTAGTIVVVAGAAVLGLVVLGLVVSAVLSFLAWLFPFALVGIGGLLLVDGRKVLGLAAVGIGGLMIVDRLSVLLLVVLAVAVGWLVARTR